MQHADKGTPSTQPDGTGLRIGIVQARFNESITNALAQACRSTRWKCPWRCRPWPSATSSMP